MNEPLAIKLRPNKVSDIIGQTHLVGDNKIITNMVNNKRLFSMILYGRPGIGKTSIAYAIITELGLRYRMLNAVINNKKEIEIVIEEAKMYNGMVVLMDEIHRMNKDKQDLLLPYLESGLITLIGMTTSNPYHKINPAIRSRCQVFELKELTEDDIIKGLNRAIKSEYLKDIKIDEESIKYIAALAAGDLRSAYNILEIVYYSTNDYIINIEKIKNINNKPVFFHDKDSDGHYDLLSAFQKSIRGSDVNASIYYLAKLLEAEDLDSIYRRMTVIAYEDIGLANPSMGPKVDAAINACERVGLPEARIPLSVVVLELALSPKSNSAYTALDNATNDIRIGKSASIPKHIKNGSSDYLYPHDYKFGYVKQQYLPDNLKDRKYYQPKTTSKYEQNLKIIYENLKK
ncbi:MAG: replication-associated recombination protein A [Bacilli bacterium]|nr:replication-associated recombination protein A [Bacilli bacterium]MDD4282989.1 replication-associated recombination protein A [Bacilli bacterium]MDD4718811.1 replication-associated recombination protein A [Bacilli bacterium]